MPSSSAAVASVMKPSVVTDVIKRGGGSAFIISASAARTLPVTAAAMNALVICEGGSGAVRPRRVSNARFSRSPWAVFP